MRRTSGRQFREKRAQVVLGGATSRHCGAGMLASHFGLLQAYASGLSPQACPTGTSNQPTLNPKDYTAPSPSCQPLLLNQGSYLWALEVSGLGFRV